MGFRGGYEMRATRGFVLFAFLLNSILGCQQQGANTGPTEGFACVAMQPGQTVAMRTRFGELPSQYQLTQSTALSGEIIYTAEVPVQFIPAPVRGMVPNPQMIKDLWRMASACLAQVEPYLRGPNGEQLVITLNNGPIGGLEAQQITVTSENVRGHSRYWTTQWGCHEIVHEVLHLLGNVDAYADGGSYDCRAPGPRDAIMVNPDAAYRRVGLVPGMQAPPVTGAQQSILYPAEFNAIVSPHCEVSAVYAQCAANAYRSTSKQGCHQQVPQACYDSQALWYSSQPMPQASVFPAQGMGMSRPETLVAPNPLSR